MCEIAWLDKGSLWTEWYCVSTLYSRIVWDIVLSNLFDRACNANHINFEMLYLDAKYNYKDWEGIIYHKNEYNHGVV